MSTLKLVDARDGVPVAPAADSDAPTAPDRDAAGACFPIAPLVERVEAAGGIGMLSCAHIDARSYYRAKASGLVSARVADRLATKLLGEHPSAVWGWDAWVAGAGEDD